MNSPGPIRRASMTSCLASEPLPLEVVKGEQPLRCHVCLDDFLWSDGMQQLEGEGRFVCSKPACQQATGPTPRVRAYSHQKVAPYFVQKACGFVLELLEPESEVEKAEPKRSPLPDDPLFLARQHWTGIEKAVADPEPEPVLLPRRWVRDDPFWLLR
jgi:hypothetical protein